eukprot:CAMPEP_0114489386 /NCGR_PEP_ID=MMETSP0109-20121206/1864_1 /TAXON_ID=29199 /ORGANISM="Chlorarachnion reptans, Strain CCCM449" /LENGTH=184 /DNA_ID=CAMNT_0001665899 /DNA_START=218 /DNA_END=772 /DNA_ORIENTATION=+
MNYSSSSSVMPMITMKPSNVTIDSMVHDAMKMATPNQEPKTWLEQNCKVAPGTLDFSSPRPKKPLRKKSQSDLTPLNKKQNAAIFSPSHDAARILTSLHEGLFCPSHPPKSLSFDSKNKNVFSRDLEMSRRTDIESSYFKTPSPENPNRFVRHDISPVDRYYAQSRTSTNSNGICGPCERDVLY